jgi:hypothetical protein
VPDSELPENGASAPLVVSGSLSFVAAEDDRFDCVEGGTPGTGGSAGAGGVGGSNERDSDGDDIPDADDNCTDVANADQADFDEDQVGDACDEDDDNDGFPDGQDPDPFDRDNPGDFSSPESILASAPIQRAIQAIEAQGFEFDPSLGLGPPNVSARYRREAATGSVLATSSGTDVGNELVGAEFTLVLTGPLLVATENTLVFDADGTVISDGRGLRGGSVPIRGEGNRYAIYGVNAFGCVLDGSDFTVFQVGITTASIDSDSGDIVDEQYVGVTVATEGVLTSACAVSFVGETELVGEWAFTAPGPARRIGEPTEGGSAEGCFTVMGEARYGGAAYTHVVSVFNRCDFPLQCDVWTDQDPLPRRPLSVAPEATAEAIVRPESSSRAFQAFGECVTGDAGGIGE